MKDTIKEEPYGWEYREIFALPLPESAGGGTLDGTISIPIKISNLGIEFGNGPEALVTWSQIEKKRRAPGNQRSFLSRFLLRLAQRFR